MSDHVQPSLPAQSPDIPELTPEEIQAILDNLAIPSNMGRQATRQAEASLVQGDALMDAMHGGAVDFSAGESGARADAAALSAREAPAPLHVIPEIVATRQRMLQEIFPDGDASPLWESAGPGAAPVPSTPAGIPPSAPPPPEPLYPPFPTRDDAIEIEGDVFAGGYSAFRVLQTEIAALYGEVREVLAPEQAASKEARTLLSEASIMLKAQPQDLQPVEEKIQQVQEILHQAQASQRYAESYTRSILIYLSAWLLLSLGAIVFFYLDGYLLGAGQTQALGRHAAPLIITLFWGAIGGVVSAVHSLWWHTSEAQDYTYHFNTSYLVRPLVGMLLGGLIYALFAFTFDALRLDLPGNLLLSLIPSLIALLFGFRSGQLLRLIGFSPNVT